MTFKTLENRIVFAINGENINAFFSGSIHNDLPSHHQNLFARNRDITTQFDGR